MACGLKVAVWAGALVAALDVLSQSGCDTLVGGGHATRPPGAPCRSPMGGRPVPRARAEADGG